VKEERKGLSMIGYYSTASKDEEFNKKHIEDLKQVEQDFKKVVEKLMLSFFVGSDL